VAACRHPSSPRSGSRRPEPSREAACSRGAADNFKIILADPGTPLHGLESRDLTAWISKPEWCAVRRLTPDLRSCQRTGMGDPYSHSLGGPGTENRLLQVGELVLPRVKPGRLPGNRHWFASVIG
jgi:hypothetical protein